MNSWYVLAARSFLITNAPVPGLTAATGTRSFDGSIGTFFSRTGACASWLCSVNRKVWPSAGERATVSAAIMPTPPGLFSTITGVFSCAEKYSP